MIYFVYILYEFESDHALVDMKNIVSEHFEIVGGTITKH